MKTFLLLSVAFICLNTQAQNAPGYKLFNNSFLDNKAIAKVPGNDNAYNTANWIAKEKLEKLISEKKQNIETLTDNFAIPNSTKDPDTIRELTESHYKDLEKIDKEIKILEKEKNEYYRKYMKEYIAAETTTWLFNKYDSQAFFDVLYDNQNNSFNTLLNTGLNIGDNSGTIYSELLSDQLWLFRVSLSAIISNSAEDNTLNAAQNEAFQKLAAGGGNTTIKFEYPLIYTHNTSDSFNLIATIFSKGTADFKQFGTQTEDWAGSASIGLNTYVHLSTAESKFRFFALGNFSKIYGNDTFKTNLGIENKNFSFSQLTAGVVVNGFLSLSFILFTGSSESSLRNKNIIAGGQIFTN